MDQEAQTRCRLQPRRRVVDQLPRHDAQQELSQNCPSASANLASASASWRQLADEALLCNQEVVGLTSGQVQSAEKCLEPRVGPQVLEQEGALDPIHASASLLVGLLQAIHGLVVLSESRVYVGQVVG